MSYQDALAGRVSLPKQIYHITTCTHRREPLFSQLQIGRLIAHEFKYLQETQNANTLAWVVMPDHVHWLMQLEEMASLAKVIKRFKGRSTHTVNHYLHRAGPVWQKGFHEHALRQEEDIKQIARYIVANPLRAGLVTRIGDYPLWDTIWL